jgi:hypothetical protein
LPPGALGKEFNNSAGIQPKAKTDTGQRKKTQEEIVADRKKMKNWKFDFKQIIEKS